MVEALEAEGVLHCSRSKELGNYRGGWVIWLEGGGEELVAA